MNKCKLCGKPISRGNLCRSCKKKAKEIINDYEKKNIKED